MFRYYTAVIFMVIVAMFIMIIAVHTNYMLTERTRHEFLLLFILIAVAALSEWSGIYLQGADLSTRPLHIAVKVIEYSSIPFIGIIIASIFGNSPLIKYLTYIYSMHIILEIISGMCGFIFYVDDRNFFYHGAFYWIYVLMYVSSTLFFVFTAMRGMKRFQYRGLAFFMVIPLFLFTGIITQLMDTNIKVDYIVMAFSAMFIYIFNGDMLQQTDALTNLINRRGFENYIAVIQGMSVIIFFDVDTFKHINDSYGHALGDYCLKEISKDIRKSYGASGKCFRIGGDEFCVIMDKNLDSVEQLNSIFFHMLEESRLTEKHLPYVSVGYVYFDPMNDNIQDAIKIADEMMYKFKNKSKSQRGTTDI